MFQTIDWRPCSLFPSVNKLTCSGKINMVGLMSNCVQWFDMLQHTPHPSVFCSLLSYVHVSFSIMSHFLIILCSCYNPVHACFSKRNGNKWFLSLRLGSKILKSACWIFVRYVWHETYKVKVVEMLWGHGKMTKWKRGNFVLWHHLMTAVYSWLARDVIIF